MHKCQHIHDGSGTQERTPWRQGMLRFRPDVSGMFWIFNGDDILWATIHQPIPAFECRCLQVPLAEMVQQISRACHHVPCHHRSAHALVSSNLETYQYNYIIESKKNNKESNIRDVGKCWKPLGFLYFFTDIGHQQTFKTSPKPPVRTSGCWNPHSFSPPMRRRFLSRLPPLAGLRSTMDLPHDFLHPQAAWPIEDYPSKTMQQEQVPSSKLT